MFTTTVEIDGVIFTLKRPTRRMMLRQSRLVDMLLVKYPQVKPYINKFLLDEAPSAEIPELCGMIRNFAYIVTSVVDVKGTTYPFLNGDADLPSEQKVMALWEAYLDDEALFDRLIRELNALNTATAPDEQQKPKKDADPNSSAPTALS